jgi:predicted transcriptional regulator
MMNNEGVSSLPVLDSQNNVIGNISHVDVRVSYISLFGNVQQLTTS